MSCAHSLSVLYSETAAMLRKVQRGRRFNRQAASRQLSKQLDSYWRGGLDSLWSYMGQHDRWEKLQRHCQRQKLVEGAIAKSLSDEDRRFLAQLLADFGYYNGIESQARAILEATQFATFEEAATFALRQLGVRSADFELRNERIKDQILERRNAVVHSTRNNMEGITNTIVREFYDRGANPYDANFLKALKTDLGYQFTFEVKRFALTETGIVSEMAQIETYRRNGVTGKQWNINGVNTRQSHAELEGIQVGIDEQFDVGGYKADHPLDPQLPAEELVNCHCWQTPVISDDFAIDPKRIWEGQ